MGFNLVFNLNFREMPADKTATMPFSGAMVAENQIKNKFKI